MYKLCIIGAGMAGITAAIEASRLGLSVVLIDKNKKIGNKIYATGNGKCNLSNEYMNLTECYHSSDSSYVDFLSALCSDKSCEQKLKEYFSYIGLKTYTDKQGYIYPASNQASSVVWAMNDKLSANNVHIITQTLVTGIEKKESVFNITLNNKDIISSEYVISACGGKSYPKLGGSSQGYELLKGLGHHITGLTPALCAVVTNDKLCIADGVRVKTTVNLMIDNKTAYSSKGEVQISSYGLSGISVFNIVSRAMSAREQGHHISIRMNLLANIISNEEAIYQVSDSIYDCKNKTIMCALNGITHEKLALYTLEKNNISPSSKIQELSKKLIYKLIYDLYDYSCDILSTKDYDMAQITNGGLSIAEIDKNSYESKLVENLYIIGEVLDIDGICGGYNLTFAVLSALQAAKSIYDKNKPN